MELHGRGVRKVGGVGTTRCKKERNEKVKKLEIHSEGGGGGVASPATRAAAKAATACAPFRFEDPGPVGRSPGLMGHRAMLVEAD